MTRGRRRNSSTTPLKRSDACRSNSSRSICADGFSSDVASVSSVSSEPVFTSSGFDSSFTTGIASLAIAADSFPSSAGASSSPLTTDFGSFVGTDSYCSMRERISDADIFHCSSTSRKLAITRMGMCAGTLSMFFLKYSTDSNYPSTERLPVRSSGR